LIGETLAPSRAATLSAASLRLDVAAFIRRESLTVNISMCFSRVFPSFQRIELSVERVWLFYLRLYQMREAEGRMLSAVQK
jgi:hypothetical protein